jgi:hypothetical protein
MAWIALTGCGTGDAASRLDGVLRRDSAGVTVVVNAASGGPRVGQWSLRAPPLASIGSESDPVVGVTGALRLSDGRLVVADASRSLRYYAADGRPAGVVGRRGQGPGEFEQLAGVWLLHGDSLLAWDSRLDRVTVVAPTGAVARQWRLFPPAGALRIHVAAVGRAGHMLVTTVADSFAGADRLSRAVERTFWLPSPDTRPALVGRFAGRLYYTASNGNRAAVPLSGSSVFAVRGEAVYVAGPEDPELRAFRPDGSLTMVVRGAGTRRAVTGEHIALEREARIGAWRRELGSAPNFPQIQAALEEVPYPTHLPPYQQVYVDPSGFVWLQDFQAPGEEIARFQVLDSSGVFRATARMPPRFRVTHVGDRHIVGVRRDALEVERVEVYELLGRER